jgi:hypothetical protein
VGKMAEEQAAPYAEQHWLIVGRDRTRAPSGGRFQSREGQGCHGPPVMQLPRSILRLAR